MAEPVDHDRALFEQALEDLEGATTSKISRLKDDGKSLTLLSRSHGLRRLHHRRRTVEPDHTIDLHGLEAKPALARLRRFLSDRKKAALVLIIHGKGRGILRRNVVCCLDEHPRVAEHIQAPPRLGGGGARLARLR